MDPITTAIIAGVATSVAGDVTAVGKKAEVDAYDSIKNTVKSKFGKDSKLSKVIAEFEENPESQRTADVDSRNHDHRKSGLGS